MLIIKKKFVRKRCRGSGFLDSLISAVTSNTAKEIATNVTKKALTDLGNKASEKVINKIFESPKVEDNKVFALQQDPKQTEIDRRIASLLSRGKGIKRI